MSDVDPLQAAERLEAAMTELTGEVSTLRDYGERNRHMIWGLVGSILLSLAMGVVAVTASAQARHATSQAKLNAQNAQVTCESGNEARRVSRQLWTYILNNSAQQPNLTAQQMKQIAQFRGYIRTVYADRDCGSAANPTPVAPGTITPTR